MKRPQAVNAPRRFTQRARRTVKYERATNCSDLCARRACRLARYRETVVEAEGKRAMLNYTASWPLSNHTFVALIPRSVAAPRSMPCRVSNADRG